MQQSERGRRLTRRHAERRAGTAGRRGVSAALLAVVFAAAAMAGCDGFYAGVGELTPGPTATARAAGAGPELTGLPPERLAELAGRAALAARLGIDPLAPSLERVEGATWTDSSPGCYPVPTDLPRFLIPGLRVSLSHEGVLYEYDSDLAGTTGGLCEGVPLAIGAIDAGAAVETLDPSALVGETVVLRSAQDARAFSELSPGVASILADEIAWDEDDLAGTAFAGPGCDTRTRVTGALWDGVAGTVTVEVEVASAGVCEGDSVSPVWVLLDATPPETQVIFRAVAVDEIVEPTPERLPVSQRTPGPGGP